MRRADVDTLHTSDGPFVPEIAAVALAATVGVLITVSPLTAAAAAASIIPLWLLSFGSQTARVYGLALGGILIGYAFLGRGFAYAGARPVYVGDIVLGIAVVTTVVYARRLRLTTVHVLLFAFMALGALRTIPYLALYGVDALRDAAVWGYAFFAIAISLFFERRHLVQVVRTYGRLIPWFIAWLPVAAIIGIGMKGSLPTWPGTTAEIISFKGDMGVHLAGVAAFLLLGLGAAGRRLSGAKEFLVWSLWLVDAAIVAAINRGGMLALACGTAIALFVRVPASRRIRFFGVTAFVLALLVVVNPQIPSRGDTTVSLRQTATNAWSIFDDEGDGALQGTKDFRLSWWTTIWDYTVHGEYFWTGKGFGINLGDDDGFASDRIGSLRAPHNTHVTVLARTGVPGFALWIALQLAFAVQLGVAAARARRRGHGFWFRLDVWLLAVWTAMMVNTSFDPYLEGPQGAIWFWSIFGFGLAALRLQRDSLEDPWPGRPAETT